MPAAHIAAHRVSETVNISISETRRLSRNLSVADASESEAGREITLAFIRALTPRSNGRSARYNPTKLPAAASKRRPRAMR